jgi:cell division protein FtsN
MPVQNSQNQNGQNQNGQKPAQNGQSQVPAQNQVPNNQPANQTVSATQVVTSAIYQLIVSSLTNLTDAQKELANFISKGYTNATIVEGNGRYRISLGEYSDVSTANKKLNELKKKDSSYNNAWLLKK